jgi:hypothetical protein
MLGPVNTLFLLLLPAAPQEQGNCDNFAAGW